jgi:hypothetical protein
MDNHDKPSKSPAQVRREKRLAEALRANLRRRKVKTTPENSDSRDPGRPSAAGSDKASS